MQFGLRPSLASSTKGLSGPRNSADSLPLHTAPDLPTTELQPPAEAEDDGRRFPKRKVIKNKFYNSSRVDQDIQKIF